MWFYYYKFQKKKAGPIDKKAFNQASLRVFYSRFSTFCLRCPKYGVAAKTQHLRGNPHCKIIKDFLI